MRKQIHQILVFTLLLGITGCEDYTQDYPVPAPSIVGKFSYSSATEFDPPDTVTFTNETYIPPGISGSVTYLWDFGDSTTSTEENPVHIFTEEGAFNITLTPQFDGENRTIPFEDKLKFVAQLKGDTLFFEDFEDLPGQVLPDDWAVFNLDQGTVASSRADFQGMNDSAWIVFLSADFEGFCAIATSWYDEADLDADDWMILPKVTATEESILQWDAMSLTSSGNYPDSYKIWVSTTTQDSDGCMVNPLIYRVVDEEWGTDRSNPGEGIQNRSVSLKKYAGQEIYIGFQLMTPYPGGDRIGIDNIAIINP
jgi:PKD repeat protein